MQPPRVEFIETIREVAGIVQPGRKGGWTKHSDAELIRELERMTVDRLKDKVGRTQFLIIHAISGVGKSTIGKQLEEYGFVKLPLVYTRPRRLNEVNGKDYYFVTEDEFDRLVRQGKLAFFRRVFGASRGMIKDKLHGFLRDRKRFYVEGSARDYWNLKQTQSEFKNMEYLAVFLLPPGFDEWLRRLNEQRLSQGSIDERLDQRDRLLDAGRMVNEGIETAFLVNDDVERIVKLLLPVLDQS